MKTLLKITFTGILGIMLYATVLASLDRNVLQAARELFPDPWFRATLLDTYFAFFTIFLWVAYKENSLFSKIAWFSGIMILGNFAIAAYLLIQLFRLKPDESANRIWSRNS